MDLTPLISDFYKILFLVLFIALLIGIFKSPWGKGLFGEAMFRRLCSRNVTGHQLPFDIILADKRCNSAGLQLVDLIARPIRKENSET